MKLIIGILALIIILTGATLIVLALWGIQPFSLEVLWKSGLTIGIVSGTAIAIYMLYCLFFKRYSHNKDKGDKAHPYS